MADNSAIEWTNATWNPVTGIPKSFIRQVFEVMEQASQHTFQILTERHERLAELAPTLP